MTRIGMPIEHLRSFLIGTEFDVMTDHKALEAIINNPRSKEPASIENVVSKASAVQFSSYLQKRNNK